MSGEGSKPWDRPWTLQEIRDNASNWSLAGDAGMLNYLVQFSQDFVERAQGTTASLDNLFTELDSTESDLHNVCNSFNGLVHTQFVENRVAEEEETLVPAPSGGPSTKQPVEPVNVETQVREVVKNSLAFLDQMFETVEVPVGSDSEDDDDSSPSASGRSQIILKPINPYSGFRLPHIIGSKEFEEDDNVGLVLTPSDEDESDEEEESSPLAELRRPRPPQVSESSSECEAEGGATFSLPSDDDASIFSPNPSLQPLPISAQTQPRSFADELASKLGVSSTQWNQESKPVTPAAPSNSQSQIFPPVDQREPPGLFGGDEEDEYDDWIFDQNRGTFSGGRGLFDDTPDTEAPPPVVSKPQAAPVVLEDDDDDGIFSKQSLTKPAAAVSQSTVAVNKPTSAVNKPKPAVTQPVQSKLGDLFGDDGDDDIFISPPADSAAGKSAVLLFSDEEDLFAAPTNQRPPQTTASSQPARTQVPQSRGQVPQTRGSPQPFPRSTEVTREESPKPEDTPPARKVFGGRQVFPTSLLRRQPSSSSEDSEPPRSIAKSTEADDSLAKSKSREPSVPKTEKPKLAARTVEPEPVKTTSASAKKIALFDDNDSEDDLFSEKKPSTQPKKTSQPTKPPPASEPTKQQKISLFGDSDEEDFLAPIPNKSSTQSKTNLFADDEIDPSTKPTTAPKSLFGEPDLNITPKPVNKTPNKTPEKSINKGMKSKASLFNDSESEDEVLFSSASSGSSKSSHLFDKTKTPANTTATTTGRHGLFDDEWLFNAPKADSSSLFGEADDLFATKTENVTQKSVITSEKKQISQDSDLFNTEDNRFEDKSTGKTTESKKDVPHAEKVSNDASTGRNIVEEKMKESVETLESRKEIPPSKSNDIFADEDNLFANDATKPKENKTSKPVSLFAEKDNIFDEKNDNSKSKEILESKNKVPESNILFAQEDKASEKSKPTEILENKTVSQSNVNTENIFKDNKQPSKLSNIFSDADDDLFAPKSSFNISSNIFDDSDDLFATKPSVSIPNEKTTPVIATTGNKTSEDINESVDVLPSQKESNDIAAPNSNLTSKIKLFEDETTIPKKSVALFDAEEDTDIFTSPDAKKQQDVKANNIEDKNVESKPEEKEVIKVRNEPPKSLNVKKVASLFTDVEEKSEDLFPASTSNNKSPAVPEKPAVQNLKPDSGTTAPKISPIQRGLGLGINPLALLPGGKSVKPYRQTSKQSPDNSPTTPPADSLVIPQPEFKPDTTEKPAFDKPEKPDAPEKPDTVLERPEVKPREILPQVPEKPTVKPRKLDKPEPKEEGGEVKVPEIVTSVSSPVEGAISFDDPALSNTLHCPGKDRIRIQHKRRASTRRNRITNSSENTQSSNITHQSPEHEITPKPTPRPTQRYITPPPLLDREPPPLPPSNPMSPSTDEEDVFDLPPEDLGDDDDGLFKPVPNLALSPFDTTPNFNTETLKPNINLFPDTDKTPSFSSPVGENPVDIFGDNSKSILFPETKLFSKSENDDNTEIFPKVKTSKSTVKSDELFPEKENNDSDIFSNTDKLFAGTNDNIFVGTGNTPVVTSPTSDDLFATPSENTPAFLSPLEDNLFTTPKIDPLLTSSIEDGSKSTLAFSNPNDDVFVSPSENTPAFMSPVKDDIFASPDNTPVLTTPIKDDLFDNPPQTVHETTPALTDPIKDDLFTSPSASTPVLTASIKDDLFTSPSASTPVLTTSIKDDLFTSPSASTPALTDPIKDDLFTSPSASTPVLTTSIKDDLFTSPSASTPALTDPIKDDLFTSPSESTPVLTASIKDDLFTSPSESTPVLTASIKDDLFTSPSESTPALTASIKDDLFDTSPSIAKKTPSQLPSIPIDDDDLFSTKVKSPAVATSVKKTTPKKTAVDIFDEPSDEEFFSPPAKPPASKPVASKTTSSKPAMSKPAASKPAVVDLFGDGSDEEDLFASSSSVTKSRSSVISKPKQELPKASIKSSKPVTKSIVKKDDDFEDPLMAFQQD